MNAPKMGFYRLHGYSFDFLKFLTAKFPKFSQYISVPAGCEFQTRKTVGFVLAVF